MSADALGPYPSPEALEEAIAAAAMGHGRETWVFGESCEGRPLRALRRAGDPDGGTVLCVGNIHGVEFIGTLLALALYSTERWGASMGARGPTPSLVVVPTLNPDGYAATWSARGAGTLLQLRTNARGVDLNRNFPVPPGCRHGRLPGTGATRPGRATYRGPHPLSEPETAALDVLARSMQFRAVVSCHSFMGRLIPPKVTASSEYRTYRSLCRSATATQPTTRYGVLSSRWLDSFTGELEDHLHHQHRAWSICFETFPVRASARQHLRAPSLFWRFNPRHPEPWIHNDLPALERFLCAASAIDPPRGAGG